MYDSSSGSQTAELRRNDIIIKKGFPVPWSCKQVAQNVTVSAVSSSQAWLWVTSSDWDKLFVPLRRLELIVLGGFAGGEAVFSYFC